MTPLYSEIEFKNYKSRQKLPLKCEHCNQVFYITKHQIQNALLSGNIHKRNVCSLSCLGQTQNKSKNVICVFL